MSAVTLPTPKELLPFTQIAKLLLEAHIRAEERAEVTHERFNVFTTVLKATDEVCLHTRFIHCLLDPKGSHDCGALFLNLFFDTINGAPVSGTVESKAVSTEGFENTDWTLYKEASRSGFGQMDILMESSKFGIAIENKIGAREQDNQVLSYASYLENKFKTNSLVIYLTLDGKESYTAGDRSYLRISYAEHILQWLEKCLQATYQIIPINQVILQYRQVVRQLTNKTLNTEKMQKIVEFVRANPDIIRFRAEIAEAAKLAIQEIWNEIEEKIRKSCPKGYEIRVDNPCLGGLFGKGTSCGLMIIPPKDSSLSAAPFEVCIEHDEISETLEKGELGVGLVRRADPVKPPDLIDRIALHISREANHNQRYPLGWMTLRRGLDDKKIVVSADSLDTGIIWKYVADVEKALQECTF
jgi:hypothetical protein